MSCKALPREVLHVSHVFPQLPRSNTTTGVAVSPARGTWTGTRSFFTAQGLNRLQPGWDSGVFLSPSSAFSQAFPNLTPQMSAPSSLPLQRANCCLPPSFFWESKPSRFTVGLVE